MAIEKTVFISYRRSSYYTALALFKALTARGWDVFFDFDSIDSGSFAETILSQIRARAHFILILHADTLARTAEPGDWVRREIETAIDEKRNFVPLTLDDFDWKAAEPYLKGKLALVQGYNALPVPRGYFDEAIDKLIERYLNKSLDLVLHPAPPAAEAQAQQAIAAASAAPAPTPQQLSAQDYFQQSLTRISSGDIDGAIAAAESAIRLAPMSAGGYQARGWAYFQRGWWQNVIGDYTQAIMLSPNDARDYINRGWARFSMGDANGAIFDYNVALTLMPHNGIAYNNRGMAFAMLNNAQAAYADFEMAIRLNPSASQPYFNRGNALFALGNLQGAAWDYEQAIRLAPMVAAPYGGRASVKYNMGDRAGAIRDLEYALTLDPTYQYAREWLSRLRAGY
ncbi:MAG: TIR domain-containing protein [Chloroflexota bacterium]|nr:TIR domain-containing protein [Chloroflexota bacterium]